MVVEYIARESPAYAAAFVQEVRDAARSLLPFAERGRIVPELRDRRLRELLLGSYRLIYKVEQSGASIVGFIHGRRDLETLWRQTDRERGKE